MVDWQRDGEKPTSPQPVAVESIHTWSVKLTGEDIRVILSKQGYTIPELATVTVMVPGGGDYSGMTLDIDDDCPVVVSWKTRETA
jgi:hypothetical protein